MTRQRNMRALKLVGSVVAAILSCAFLGILFSGTGYRRPPYLEALSNAKEMGYAFSSYCEDNDGHLPDLRVSRKVVEVTLRKYPENIEFVEKAANCEYNAALSFRNPGQLTNAEQVWLLRDPVVYSAKGGPICFADGGCKMLTIEQFIDAKKIEPRWNNIDVAPKP